MSGSEYLSDIETGKMISFTESGIQYLVTGYFLGGFRLIVDLNTGDAQTMASSTLISKDYIYLLVDYATTSKPEAVTNCKRRT